MAERATRTDLGGLLTPQGHPQHELALTLQRGTLLVHAPRPGHGTVEVLQLFDRDVRDVRGQQGIVRDRPLFVQDLVTRERAGHGACVGA